ncbi:DNA repair and recombination protein RadB [Candidatus Pacearchaeota archaeon CG10_big_fil_rev_8_21_14_0_10_35_219]|nr:DNA repair and recombination protein RadB [Candidatus Pacearchaeota archaeon]OIO42880.1 MAG: DNA repair and recombination protein RadB [Candidatus Pacearchaeota archaeon CG1_02_35_32]PIO07127.1 MAG: DNA repair and recombination protein RadB [Candidatus Pacearchaeota archaeon CG10_big_fil_rev_8_21_14_0_10_35_219]PIY81783.1 MAG: DNA repair and recombination protein RadB [Candidatus Pacearchaeota archaeon CG_4_10_14_0_8_um_filter_35_169]PIZ80923.1 MAG: DNA repair and recombination protein RadB 
MAKIGSGSYDINKWLYGGYERDVITCFYGGPGTGKTNFCLLAAVSQAKKGNKVIYIDTEGGFSSDRTKQLINNGNGKGLDSDGVLRNILILRATNFKEQKKAFDDLLKNLKKEVSLIVVDGMTMLYRLELGDARDKEKGEIQKVNSELARQMRVLAEIARKQGIPVLVTNQVYSWDGKIGMVGGDILKYWSKCLIELENDKGRRFAYLRKHRSLGEKSLGFQIWNGGVRKRGWL